MATWSVFEYARLYRGNHKQTDYCDGGNLLLNKPQFDSLKKLISSNESDHNKLFRYGFERQQEVLTCRNYVGVICLPDGDQIEILPKTHRLTSPQNEEDLADARNNLIKMLMATRHLPSKTASTASLKVARMPLLDVFIQLFLSEVNKLVKAGIAQSYETQEENLVYLKGKLLVSKHIKHNLVTKHRHYMSFDERSANRPENRLIHSALQWAVKRVQGATEHLCQELLFHFATIPQSLAISHDMKVWQSGRLLQHYKPIRPWLEMIFQNHSPTSVKGSEDMLSLLFPMERVFEDYVAQKLKTQFPDRKINTQSRQQSLVTHQPDGQSEQPMFQLRPDLLIKSDDGRVIVADTKWKLIDERKPDQKYGISQADFYQMLAYNQAYQTEQDPKETEIWVIYPLSEKFSKALPDFKFKSEVTIRVLPFDISKSKLLTAKA